MLDTELSDGRDRHAVGVVGLHLSVVLDVITRLEVILRDERSTAVRQEVASGAELIASRVLSLRSAADHD
jgi:hypothetical protein